MRAQRPRLPKEGYFRIAELPGVGWTGSVAEGQDRFVYNGDDLRKWHNLAEVEFVALHFWIESRIRFKSVNPEKRLAILAHKSRMRLSDDHQNVGASYYVENVFEALTEPGQWYLDRPTGRLYYLPRPGEGMADTEVIAPVLDRLVIATGNPEKQAPVRGLHFEGLALPTPSGRPARKP